MKLPTIRLKIRRLWKKRRPEDSVIGTYVNNWDSYRRCLQYPSGLFDDRGGKFYYAEHDTRTSTNKELRL